jgi:hypothetical protein
MIRSPLPHLDTILLDGNCSILGERIAMAVEHRGENDRRHGPPQNIIGTTLLGLRSETATEYSGTHYTRGPAGESLSPACG